MPRFLGFAAALAVLGAALSREAHAMGALVSSPPGVSSAVEVRLALSLGPPGAAAPSGAVEDAAPPVTRTTRWVSLRIHSDATALAWILPVRPGALVDLASDGWLESLETASAPRVVPPDVSPPCEIAPGVEVDGDVAHAATTAPDGVAVAPDGATLAMGLAGWGLALPGDVASAIDAASAAGDSFVALHFTAPARAPAGTSPADVRTRTVRITEEAPADVSWSLAGLSLAGVSGTSPTVTVHVLSGGPLAWGAPGAAPALTLDPSAILWRPQGGSTYAAARDALLQGKPGGWLEETAGHRIVFQTSPVPGGTPLPSLAAAYFAKAAADGDATGDAIACTGRALAVAASVAAVSAACPSGALARVPPLAACTEATDAAEIAPDVLRCGGGADDLALALSGLAPSGAYLTRARSVLPAGGAGADVSLRQAEAPAGAEHGPVKVAAGYTLACPEADGGSAAVGGGSVGGGGSSVGGGGSNVGGVTIGVGAGVAAGAANTPPADTPSQDTTAPDDDSGDGCGGDSQSSDSSGGCNGDTSSSSSSTDGSSSGDSCGGSHGSESSSGSSDCATTRRARGRRWPFSRGVLAVTMGVWLLRRRRASA
jgi:hypothetical protein